LDNGTISPNRDGDLLVALRFLPTNELVVTILALQKAGLAYVPIGLYDWKKKKIREENFQKQLSKKVKKKVKKLKKNLI
jgi:hypothetical protein